MPEYWYLWLILAILILILIFVSIKAGKAAKKRQSIVQENMNALKKENALRKKFQSLSPELIRECPMPELLEGVAANIQLRLEADGDINASFKSFSDHEKYCYALNYFVEDSRDSLSEFFKRNGEPLISLAPKALDEIGNPNAVIVKEMFSMYDVANERVSYDEEKVRDLDKKFAHSTDEDLLYGQIREFIQISFNG